MKVAASKLILIRHNLASKNCSGHFLLTKRVLDQVEPMPFIWISKAYDFFGHRIDLTSVCKMH